MVGPWSRRSGLCCAWATRGWTCRPSLALGVRSTPVGTGGVQGKPRYLDCSRIKLHQHGTNRLGSQVRQAISRTKGGINTKLAAMVDAHGRAVALGLVPGQQHDLKASKFTDSLSAIPMPMNAPRTFTPSSSPAEAATSTRWLSQRRRVEAARVHAAE